MTDKDDAQQPPEEWIPDHPDDIKGDQTQPGPRTPAQEKRKKDSDG